LFRLDDNSFGGADTNGLCEHLCAREHDQHTRRHQCALHCNSSEFWARSPSRQRLRRFAVPFPIAEGRAVSFDISCASADPTLRFPPGSIRDQQKSPYDFTVYILDDDQSTLDSLSGFFRSLGYKTKPYAAAKAFFDEQDPSTHGCVLLDQSMPGINGLNVHRNF
jgi:hypothetical protein